MTAYSTRAGGVVRGILRAGGFCLQVLGLLFVASRLRWLAGLGLAGFMGWQGLQWAAPNPPKYSEAQLVMTERLGGEAAEWLRQLRAEPGRAVFGNLGHDEFGAVSKPLREAVWRSDEFELLDRGLADRLRAKMSWPFKTYDSSTELARVARSREARYAVGGEVLRFVDAPGEQLLRAHLYVWDAANARCLGERTFELGAQAPTMLAGGLPALAAGTSGGAFPITYRLFFWVVLAGLLPFAVFIHRRGLLVEAGNVAIFLVLATLTTVAGASLYWIVGRGLEPFWSGFWLLVLVPADALYNFKLLAFLQETSA